MKLSTLLVAIPLLFSIHSQARLSPVTMAEKAKKAAETQVQNLIEPLVEKYCQDQCKILSVTATVDIATPEQIAPGFDDMDPKSATTLEPSSARIKLLVDDKIGPISRQKLLDVIQQYLDTLDYPVKIDLQLTHLPQPVGSAGKVTELRDQVTKDFKKTVNDLFAQFCPTTCLLGDYNLKTDVTNPEEAQYGKTGEYLEDNGTAIRIKEIAATILVDEVMPVIERQNILEIIQLKTNQYKNVLLSLKAMKFPQPIERDSPAMGYNFDPKSGKYRRAIASIGSATEDKSDSKSLSTSTQSSDQKSENKLDSKTDSKTDLKSDSTLQQKSTSNEQNSNSNESESSQNLEKSENNQRHDKYERYEKIERVENGDAVQAELKKFKIFGLIFACSVIALLIFVALSTYQGKSGTNSTHKIVSQVGGEPNVKPAQNGQLDTSTPSADTPTSLEERATLIGKRYEIQSIIEELTHIFAQNPKVAKHVFTRILTEEGVEITSKYVHLFGESVVLDMLRDPSLQADINNLIEFYAKNPLTIEDTEKLDLLRKLHNRVVASKLFVLGNNRSSNLFDFLSEMDGTQILELVRNESMTVKSIILTQVDPQKRQAIYGQMDEDTRGKLLNELSRIDYLPRDYIFNVANALKRKRRDNPRLNTEALPGSEVLLTLLEKADAEMQRTVIKSLELGNPESARILKSKLISVDTLRYLRDGQMLEVIMNLKHDELLQFLKGTADNIRSTIYTKAPKDLVMELEDELSSMSALSREAYQAVERKVINRMKMMSNSGILNLIEVNERLLADGATTANLTENSRSNMSAAAQQAANTVEKTKTIVTKVAGW